METSAPATTTHRFTATTAAIDPTRSISLRALARDLGIDEQSLAPADLESGTDELAQLLEQVTISAREFHGRGGYDRPATSEAPANG